MSGPRIAAALLLGFAIIALAHPRPTSAADGATGAVTRTKLANGMTVLVRENSTAPIVAISLMLRMGTRWETRQNAGISNFLQLMVIRGTTSLDGTQIVITDEAHRSQYDQFALNMRNALPNAAFIGFTGTPLMAGEERTKQVFGDYVSIYNFKQSIDDGNTVPLYYENRIPELQLTNPDLTENMADIIDSAELDEDQERKIEREFAREYQLITREDRLERIAEDIVAHFIGRGVLAKGMVISIDKATAVRMYD